jgi:hypothetical protein
VNAPDDGDCDDGDVCTEDVCDVFFGCAYAPAAGPCEDGDACTAGDTCSGGICLSGGPTDCDDGNDCTDDACASATGCSHVPTATCDDGDPCTDDVCDVALGCQYADNTAACDDGSACTTADTCSGGACVGGPPPVCSDNNACTDDTCDPAVGCVFLANTDPCDDGDACTVGDACNGGVCTPGAPDFGCSQVPGTFCEVSGSLGDVVICDVELARLTQNTPLPVALEFSIFFDAAAVQPLGFVDTWCIGQACFDVSVPPGTLYPTGHSVIAFPGAPSSWSGAGNVAVAQSGGMNSAITQAYYANGAVVGDPLFMRLEVQLLQSIPAASASPLAFGNIFAADYSANLMPGFVMDERMVIGVADCTSVPDVCDDGNACTSDVCDPNTLQCAWPLANGEPCYDGDQCTTNDACEGGACMGGAPVDCSDGNPCTDDSCTPDGCQHAPNTASCDDGDACTAGDVCADGACAGPLSVTCDGGSECAVGTCNPAVGCVYEPDSTLCDDGASCTADACEPTADGAYGCIFAPIPGACDDGSSCTVDACEPLVANSTTGCTHTSVQPCTTLCSMSGQVGDQVECPIRVAELVGPQSPFPGVAVQLELAYDDSLLHLDGFHDGVTCQFGPCIDWTIPGFPGLQSGHTAVLQPPDPATWSGAGTLLLAHFTDPNVPLTDAEVTGGSLGSGGTLSGDPVLITAVFTLLGDIPPASPEGLDATGVIVSDTLGFPLQILLEQDVLQTFP